MDLVAIELLGRAADLHAACDIEEGVQPGHALGAEPVPLGRHQGGEIRREALARPLGLAAGGGEQGVIEGDCHVSHTSVYTCISVTLSIAFGGGGLLAERDRLGEGVGQLDDAVRQRFGAVERGADRVIEPAREADALAQQDRHLEDL